MARPWRLLVHGAAAGPWNMGVDEALMAAAAAGGPPALRLYSWDGAWLSLGYAQGLDGTRAAACQEAGVGVVRRATGGRAVLHGCDLTYAVAAPEAALPEGLRASYGAIASGLLAALEALGVAALRVAPEAPAPGPGVFDCFAEPAGDELCAADGAKLVGSAQRRAGGAVLQHGSIRLLPDPVAAREAAGLAGGRATSLAELGCRPDPGVLERALALGLADALGARFEASTLGPEERRLAARRGPEPPPSTRGGSQGYPRDADT